MSKGEPSIDPEIPVAYAEAVPSAPGVVVTETPETTTDVKIETVEISTDYGRESVQITCPFCNQRGNTKVEDKWHMLTWVWAVGFCVTIFPLACLPCCVPQLKETDHRCEHCNRIVGKTRPFQDLF
mmetsp:Transcript_16432/g.20522  ORF Transcript_16432/g.20522 Transcript_16432/m.20522 type:complete len:126 (-) Transcript_16432:225-602(-)